MTIDVQPHERVIQRQTTALVMEIVTTRVSLRRILVHVTRDGPDITASREHVPMARPGSAFPKRLMRLTYSWNAAIEVFAIVTRDCVCVRISLRATRVRGLSARVVLMERLVRATVCVQRCPRLRVFVL